MDAWAWTIVAVASVGAMFFAVMGFRGLIETLDSFSGSCAGCGRTAMLPLPSQSHRCLRCHFGAVTSRHLTARRP
jgi:hypothetical protein